jgi:hypothetical protein
VKIEQKWGFGMAPVKTETQAERLRCAESTLRLIQARTEDPGPGLEELSIVKGLFSRAFKQDQWDWFTVWRQLGRPGRVSAKQIAAGLKEVRRSLVAEGDGSQVASAVHSLKADRIETFLEAFISGQSVTPINVGYVYLLSTRENPDLLKIGYTTRDVEERVKEINSATGVLVPYGVRGLWMVRDAVQAEARVHQALSEYRVRRDREFFRLGYRPACDVITSVVRELRAEI